MKKNQLIKNTIIISILLILLDFIACLYHYKQSKKVVESLVCSDTGRTAVVFFGAMDDNGNLEELQIDRLDKAVEIFRSGTVNSIICVGGNRKNKSLFGSAVSKKYLISKGIPEKLILVDSLSYDTKSNLQSMYRITIRYNIQKIVLVSDLIHLKRITDWINFDNFCVASSKNELNIFQIVRYSNQSFISYFLDWMLGEDNYNKLINFRRNISF